MGYVKLTGAVPTQKRGALIQQFFDDPTCKVFLSTDAGGVGLNLQAADMVVNLDLPWNPAVLEQRIARAHRHGQPSSVQVINLIAKGTIEERMLDTLAAKRNVFAGVFGAEEGPAEIKFADTGQSLLQQLGELLQQPVEVKLESGTHRSRRRNSQTDLERVCRPHWLHNCPEGCSWSVRLRWERGSWLWWIVLRAELRPEVEAPDE